MILLIAELLFNNRNLFCQNKGIILRSFLLRFLLVKKKRSKRTEFIDSAIGAVLLFSPAPLLNN
jgi:hypothetical protein